MAQPQHPSMSCSLFVPARVQQSECCSALCKRAAASRIQQPAIPSLSFFCNFVKLRHHHLRFPLSHGAHNPGQLPAGWTAVVDQPSGRTCYVNAKVELRRVLGGMPSLKSCFLFTAQLVKTFNCWSKGARLVIQLRSHLVAVTPPLVLNGARVNQFVCLCVGRGV
jgi:hypothetical protein